jgi:hypothetical protein
MNRIICSIVFCFACFPFFLQAQDVHINEAVMVTGAGTYVIAPGDIIIDSNSSIQNAGSIRVGGDWINNASGLVAALPGAVEFNGTTAQLIGGVNPTNFSYLNINNPSGVDLDLNANISGLLTFLSGKINTGSHFVNMTTGPLIGIAGANTGSYVNGNLVMNFPAGSYTWKYEIGNTVYAPAVFRVNGLGAAAAILGYTVAGDGPNENVPFSNASLIDPFAKVNQYWNFEATPAVFNDFEIEFDFNYTTNTGDPQQYVTRRYTSAALWNNTTGSLTAPLKYKVTALPDLGEFVIGELTSTGLNEDFQSEIYFNNPVQDVLMISNPGQEKILGIQINDIHGRNIHEHNLSSGHQEKLMIDIRNLAAGLYIMSIQLSEGNQISRKVMKQ